jgi:uncharacterized membrane protein YeaQ/YmgE (transglycosylase-associated protein family)
MDPMDRWIDLSLLNHTIMEYLPLIIQLASGALGGNLAGKAMPKASMGTLVNSILGIVGGGLGGQLLGMLGMDVGGGMDLMGIIGSIASGGVGGGVIMAIIGVIKNAMSK